MVRFRWLILLMAVLLAPAAVRAAGTAAGTGIQSTAQVSYSLGGPVQTTSSNTTTVIVGEILDAVVTVGSTASVVPGAANQELVFTVTNTGNGTETFSLAALSAAIAGDDFDPVLAATSIYFDTDNSNDLSPADLAYVPGTNDPSLAADASVRILLVNDIPNGITDGARGRSQLTASARTGVGAPGATFAGQGDGGVDAVAGTTGGDGATFGEYVVAGLQVAAVKSQTIADQFGGNRVLPGARIHYQIVVTASGTGAATASVFSDAIPANTTYVAGSLELNDTALSDTADADAGELLSAPAPQVRVNLGDLTQASGPQTIEFAVTIN